MSGSGKSRLRGFTRGGRHERRRFGRPLPRPMPLQPRPAHSIGVTPLHPLPLTAPCTLLTPQLWADECASAAPPERRASAVPRRWRRRSTAGGEPHPAGRPANLSATVSDDRVRLQCRTEQKPAMKACLLLLAAAACLSSERGSLCAADRPAQWAGEQHWPATAGQRRPRQG